MIDFSLVSLAEVSVHQIGNKTNGESLIVSKEPLAEKDEKLEELLLQYFLKPFHNPEYYHLTFSNDDHALNPIYHYAEQCFEHPESFHIQSIHLAKHLFETALHPNIKPGDFYVARFKDLQWEGNLVEGMGLFKAETKDHFIKMKRQGSGFDVQYDLGTSVDKLDKGCLILNIESEKGFKVCVVDKVNKGAEAQYWKDQYLKIKPCSDNFHFTENLLTLTKDFVTKQLTEEYEVSKADQIDLLNKSVSYFKDNERFDQKEFSQSVFGDHEGLITSFKDFKEQTQKEYEIELLDNFDISDQAVKKQAKIFKSVLKLDKNFHIYIHGNKNMIEKGVEPDGRKYYKIYYTEEN
ncbi:MAG: nucleoid-associated protein [Bacteroidia bacterium]|nr:nucleoid-associated protein [Bacteroidia bacterium]MCF8445388.1 nucleoid-associated protein [Bacteroidia bacterium]